MTLLREFKPTILFLVKFTGIYLIGNLLYGFFITAYDPQTDPCTSEVTKQAAVVLNLVGFESAASDHAFRPYTLLIREGKTVVSVYEGCNGINVMVVFLAFIVAMGPFSKKLLWFSVGGLVMIHLFNLMRIVLLFWVTLYLPGFLYFSHKYLFTAFLYLAVFGLWILWVRKFSKQNHAAK